MAHWAVAHSKEMGISRVSYGRHGWIAGKDRGRWQDKSGARTKDGAKDPHTAEPGEVRIFMTR